MRGVGGVAIDHAIAVIHGADKCLLPALFAFAPSTSIAAVVHGSVSTAIAILGGETVLTGRLRLGRLLRRVGLAGPWYRFGIGVTICLIVGVSLTSTAPATMPLPFTLPCRLSLIRRLSLWLVLLCCHACTSRCVGNSCSLLSCDLPRTGEGRDRLQLTFPFD